MINQITKAINDLLAKGTCKVTVDREIKGTAWLVDDAGHLLTAGHVLSEEDCIDEFEVRFPNDIPRKAWKINYGFDQKLGIDFAVLKLDPPIEDRQPLPLSLKKDFSGNIRARGYGKTLKDQSTGVGSYIGSLYLEENPDRELYQLESKELGDKGYSGAAIFSDELKQVVGIQIEATKNDTGPQRDIVLAMPLYRIAKYWEFLEKIKQNISTEERQVVQINIEIGEDKFLQNHNNLLQFSLSSLLKISPDRVQTVGNENENEKAKIMVKIPKAHIDTLLDIWGQKRNELEDIFNNFKIISIHPYIPKRYMPPLRPVIIGREEKIEKICKSLEQYPITSVVGGPGLGKTVLAKECSYRAVALKQFDFLIWTESNKKKPLLMNEIIDTILFSANPPAFERLTEDKKESLAKNVLESKRCLLIVDNMETINDQKVFSFIEEIPEKSRVLTTSRHRGWKRLEDKSRQTTIPLDELIPAESLDFFRKKAEGFGLLSISEESSEKLIDLVNAFHGIPLAMEIALGRVANEGLTLPHIVETIKERNANELLDTLYMDYWRQFDSKEKDVLYAMALYPYPPTIPAIGAAIGLGEQDVSKYIGNLIQVSIVTLFDALAIHERYTIHPFTRDFVLVKNEKGLEESITHKRMAEYFCRFLERIQTEIQQLDSAYQRIDLEYGNILNVLDWCHEHKETEIELKIINNLMRFMWNRGYWNDRVKIVKRAIKELDSTAYPQELAQLYCYQAWVYSRIGNQEKALFFIQKARDCLSGEECFLSGLIEHILGQIRFRDGRHFEEAEKHMLIALQIYSKRKSPKNVLEDIAVSDVKDNLGDLNRDWGLFYYYAKNKRQQANLKFKEAKRNYLELLEFAQKNKWSEKIATAKGDIGHIEFFLHNYQFAEKYLQEGLKLAQKIDRRNTISCCHLGLGQLYVFYKRNQNSVNEHLEEAKTIYVNLGQDAIVKKINMLLSNLSKIMEQDIKKIKKNFHWIHC